MDKDIKEIIVLLFLILVNFSSVYKGLKLQEQVDALKIEVAEKQKRIDELAKFNRVGG